MISASDLQALFSKIDGTTVAVDLLRVGPATSYGNGGHEPKKLRLALDMEDCLDRFYGGYFSDWACGGQWKRASQFVDLLLEAFEMAHIEVIAFFDGTLPDKCRDQGDQKEIQQKTISVLRHIRMIGTPPPKIWWLHPSGIRTVIRNCLRFNNIQVIQTVQDHRMEIIDYYREFHLDGIFGLNSDYIFANVHHYYSSHDLRLSYKGSTETKEFLVSKLLSSLGLSAEHLPFLAVFLGGKIVHDRDVLKQMLKTIKVEYASEFEARTRELAKIIRGAPVNDVDAFIKHLKLEQWSANIKETVEYYQRKGQFSKSGKKANFPKKNKKNKSKTNAKEPETSKSVDNSAALASETTDQDAEFERKLESDVNNLVDECEDEISDSATSSLATELKGLTIASEKDEATNKSVSKTNKPEKTFVYTMPSDVIRTAYNRHQRGMMDPRLYQLLTKKEIVFPQILEDEQYREIPSVHLFYRPARQMIYAILFNVNHQKYIYSKQNKTSQHKVPTVTVNEWIWSPQNEYKRAEVVSATQLKWAVPTIQRLWFGTLFEDKQRRMKAFLTIMRSDTPLMLNPDYVPQHLLTLAVVLRYIVTSPDRNILSNQELDAFLATAFSPHLCDIQYTQELVLQHVSLRGVYLGTLFMQGFETANMANDACGVPLPWRWLIPTLFFDGKLFQLKLKLANYVQSLREVCEDHFAVVLKVERFRKAILEDVEHYLLPAYIGNIGKHNLPYFPPGAQGTNQYYPHLHEMSNVDRRRSVQQHIARQLRVRDNDEYQLKVGGVVVGSWAGNLSRKSSQIHPNMLHAGASHQRNRINYHLLYNNRNKKKPTIGGGTSINRVISRKSQAESKVTKAKPKKNRNKNKTTASSTTKTTTSQEPTNDAIKVATANNDDNASSATTVATE